MWIQLFRNYRTRIRAASPTPFLMRCKQNVYLSFNITRRYGPIPMSIENDSGRCAGFVGGLATWLLWVGNLVV